MMPPVLLVFLVIVTARASAAQSSGLWRRHFGHHLTKHTTCRDSSSTIPGRFRIYHSEAYYAFPWPWSWRDWDGDVSGEHRCHHSGLRLRPRHMWWLVLSNEHSGLSATDEQNRRNLRTWHIVYRHRNRLTPFLCPNEDSVIVENRIPKP